MARPRILLADDHAILLEAFKALLEPEYDVVGTVTDGRTLLTEFARLRPDVVLLDVSMPMLNGLDAGRRLKADHPGVRLIYLTMNPDPELAGEALRLGAAGYVLKSSAASELTQAIGEALRGRLYLTPLLTQNVVDALVRRRPAPELTDRQREVLQLIAEGHSMKEIGHILQVAPRTVAFHKYRMMRQLRLRTNAELIQFAVKLGMVA